MSVRWFTQQEYDAVLLCALRRLGLTADDARRLIASRWPMPGQNLLQEAFGRGLVVTLAHVGEFLTEIVGTQWADGEPVDAASTFFTPRVAEAFFRWAVESGRAKPTQVGRLLAKDDRTVRNAVAVANAEAN